MAGFGGFGTATQGPSLFGTTKPTTGGFSFGTPASTAAALSFGTQPSTSTGQAQTGFQLGATTTTATTGFAQPLAAPAAKEFGIATPFGQTSAKSTPQPSFAFGLGTTTRPQVTGLGFGTRTVAPLTSTGLSFNTATQPLGGLGQAAGSLDLTQKTTAGVSAFSFSLATGTAPSLGGGSFSVATLGSTPAAPATTSVGLGGVDTSQTKPGLSGSGVTEPKQAKDNLLPDLIIQTLTEFQNHTRQQKSISVEVSHNSSKPLKKVQEDTEALESMLTNLNSSLTKNAIAVDKLKTETAQGLHQAEMAQRTHDLTPGLEYDHSVAGEYFDDLVAKFEGDTMRLRAQIEASEKHLKSLTQSATISPQELTLAMRRLHETLVVLAARVQTLHASVDTQKEQLKGLQRVFLKGDSPLFRRETPEIRKQTTHALRSLTGPTPFSESPRGAPLNQDALAALGASSVSAFPNPTTLAASGWMNPSQNFSTQLATPQPVENTAFSLSKPPVGNKRNKR